MAKAVDNSVLDAALGVIDNAIRQAVCSAQPANYAGIAALRLAEATMAPADFVIAAGDLSGRKVTVAAKNAVPITAGGTATHIVLHDNASVMQYVTTCTSQALTNGNTVNLPLWKVEIAAPT